VAEFDRDEVVNEARVFARPRNKGMDEGAVGEAGPEWVSVGWDEDRLTETSDSLESVLPGIGTIRLCTCWSKVFETCDVREAIRSNPGGISSAAGMGSPRAAATS